MAKKNRTCVVCKSQYQYCPNCAADAGKPTWMFSFCSETCSRLYDVVTPFNLGYEDKETAQKKLKSIDLTDYTIPKDIQEVIDKIKETKVDAPKAPKKKDDMNNN